MVGAKLRILGTLVGRRDGLTEGDKVGFLLGATVGLDGINDGLAEGEVGVNVDGETEGKIGFELGADVGVGVWMYAGLLKDADPSVNDDGRPQPWQV